MLIAPLNEFLLEASSMTSFVTPVFGLSGYQVIAGLATVYLGLIACWGIYWLVYGNAERKRHDSLASLTATVRKQEKNLASMQHEFTLAFEAFKAGNARIESLKLEIIELNHRVEQLESAQFEIEQTIRVSSDDVVAANSAPAADDLILSMHQPQMDGISPEMLDFVVDDTYGLVYKTTPDHPDDLTELWGIGAVNQQRLNEHGVFFFEQIAHWTQEHVSAFNDILGFKGRIEREGWVSQATDRVQSDRKVA
ncbi:hypothetical protein N9N28_12065 [Rubripirellula amarantea]|uniref:NADH dehydrogenase subunit E n=1 Tax=Rubripirellula amarantea TaxID=2527999 RepID=A0A5C5WEE0_9BACT|nr:hypothetical protein [Rubripirellula amarantea]MDA8745362.1 hypothetical protein [Rubripirellula amarantea]TWT49188.1 NADH dehydrogenase subunit E [Rubripirellula amarantea]